MSQGSLKANEETQYRITFTPVNPLPLNGKVELWYPKHISLSGDWKCTITTDYRSFDDKCKKDGNPNVNIIYFENFIDNAPYSSDITITINDFKNPSSSKRERYEATG